MTLHNKHSNLLCSVIFVNFFYNFSTMTSLCRHLSVVSKGNCKLGHDCHSDVHTVGGVFTSPTRRNTTVSSRRRCVLGFIHTEKRLKAHDYTMEECRVTQKIGTRFYALTLPNINRFLKLFHCQTQEKICNNTIANDFNTPHVCRYTTLWNVSVLKATTENKTSLL